MSEKNQMTRMKYHQESRQKIKDSILASKIQKEKNDSIVKLESELIEIDKEYFARIASELEEARNNIFKFSFSWTKNNDIVNNASENIIFNLITNLEQIETLSDENLNEEELFKSNDGKNIISNLRSNKYQLLSKKIKKIETKFEQEFIVAKDFFQEKTDEIKQNFLKSNPDYSIDQFVSKIKKKEYISKIASNDSECKKLKQGALKLQKNFKFQPKYFWITFISFIVLSFLSILLPIFN